MESEAGQRTVVRAVGLTRTISEYNHQQMNCLSWRWPSVFQCSSQRSSGWTSW